jgi:hypothetical protein
MSVRYSPQTLSRASLQCRVQLLPDTFLKVKTVTVNGVATSFERSAPQTLTFLLGSQPASPPVRIDFYA